MPGIAQRINNSGSDDNDDTNISYLNQVIGVGHTFNGSSISSNGFWSKHRDDVSYNQLQKFWSELMPQARQNLLRVEKHMLFEHARQKMYCSRCNGLLLEGFLQIVMYGKSLQLDAAGGNHSVRATISQNDGDLCMASGYEDDAQDPSVHPWGGLTTARDGTLTLLDCYLYAKSLKGLQIVFNSARTRERERELLYPDACGGGGRGWISQGIAGYGRGHGTRETCALHTARLSVETLVDFWSALGEETRQSLLRMKEEDFVERLTYRFDCKRFCRDCRRNVIREFKELKELNRMRREPRCTSWFCAVDTAFQYVVSCDSVQADWHQTFSDAFGRYHHFEWAIGTGEGKSDILEFENVGLSTRVQVNGLDLSGLISCYITLRAWKMDGRCSELCVKAHALQGQQCAHCRLVVGDGFVTITRGESITTFFEHAEEAEEEEDDDSMVKDGNELDGECSRPQKHAKSPELAQEFLLDAATVIFKEQVEKAFREGTARQNSHSIFVCLALKLLEERVHVACKEIITLEKQMKLLEEEEREKCEEEERKERRRTKEREKKLRRKERLREKENRDKKCCESNIDPVVSNLKESTSCINEGADVISGRDSFSETGEATPSSLLSPDIQDDQALMDYIYTNMENHSENIFDGESGDTKDWDTSFPYDQIKYSRRKPKFRKELQWDLNLKLPGGRKVTALSENGFISSNHESRYHADGFESPKSINCFNKQLRSNAAKSNFRNCATKLSQNFKCNNSRIGDRYDSHACSCNHHNEYRSRRSRPESHITGVREPKYVNKLDSLPDAASKPYYHGTSKFTQTDFACDVSGRLKSKIFAGNPPNTKKVWEPRKKYILSNSDSDVTLRSTTKVEASESSQPLESSDSVSSDGVTDTSFQINHDDINVGMLTGPENCRDTENELSLTAKYSKEALVAEDGDLCSMSSSSNSNNCSSWLSEGDSNSNPQNLESTFTSDSEESSQYSEQRESSHFLQNGFPEFQRAVEDHSTLRGQDVKSRVPTSAGTNNLPQKTASYSENGRTNVNRGAQSQTLLSQLHDQSIHYPVFQAPTMGYFHQSPVSWTAGPTNALMSFPQPNHYLFANSFGYGLNGNARFMRYVGLQQPSPSLLDHTYLPVLQPISPVNGVSTKDPAKVPHQTQRLSLKDQHHAEVPLSVVDAGLNGKFGKRYMGNDGFSLFHFGGPVALSSGFKSNTVSLTEGNMADTSSNSSANCAVDDENPCNKKDKIEEYNLFAASNGIKFSFF